MRSSAAGKDLALLVHDAGQLVGGDLDGLERLRPNIDLHLAEHAAEHRGRRQPFDAREFLAQFVIGQVEQILVVAVLAGDDEVADRNGRASYFKTLGGCMPGGMYCISPYTSEFTWPAATSGSTSERK